MAPPLQPGDYVTIKRSAAGRFAGRSGLVVTVDEARAVVRFGPSRGYGIALCDLVRLADAVRRP